MTTFKIWKSAVLTKGKKRLSHDEIVMQIIRRMRKFGNRLVYYDEEGGSETVLKFEEVVK